MEEIVTHKKCSKCGEVKLIREFYLRGEKRRDPYRPECKKCGKAKMGRWYAKNSEHQKQKSKNWRVRNLLHCLIRDRKYHEEHKEERKKQHKQWVEKNYDKVIQNNRNRRARQKNAEGKFTADEFKKLCAEYDNICLCCGEKKKLTADHVVPLDKGGSNYISNIQPLCGSCNSKKKNKTVDYRKVL